MGLGGMSRGDVESDPMVNSERGRKARSEAVSSTSCLLSRVWLLSGWIVDSALLP